MYKKTLIKTTNKNDLKKMQTNLSNLEQSSKVAIKFTLTNFIKSCVDSQSKNELNCYYLVEADGIRIMVKTWQKIKDKEESVHKIIHILISVLSCLPHDLVALKIAEQNTGKYLIDIINDKKNLSLSQSCLELLNKLTLYDLSHNLLIEQGLGQFLKDQLEDYSRKDLSTLKKEELIELGRIFDILFNLAKLDLNAQVFIDYDLINILSIIYQQNQDHDFIKQLTLQTLSYLSKIEQLKEPIKQSQFDLQILATDSLEEKNEKIIQIGSQIINNLTTSDDIKKNIDITIQNASEQNLIFLSFLSQNEKYSDQFDNKELLKVLMNKLKDVNLSDISQITIFQIITTIIKVNQNLFKTFEQEDGIDIILQSLSDFSGSTHLYLITVLNFLNKITQISSQQFITKLQSKNIISQLMQFYIGLKDQYNSFKQKSLTEQLAQDSIQYYKSEVTRALLLTKKEIQIDQLANEKLAQSFLSCEKLTVIILKFFETCKVMHPQVKLQMDDEFFITTNLLLRVYKVSKIVHETLMSFLSNCDYDANQGQIIVKENYQTTLCNKIWLKPQWKKFALYTLRFIEKLIKKKKNLDKLKQGTNTVRLVASIKNFLNEEEFLQFEDQTDEQEILDIDILSYAEEREIHKKSSFIMEELMDSTLLGSFKQNINKSLKFFKPQPESVLILRAEYAVLTCANGINTYGCEGLKNDMQDWLLQNIEIIEQNSKKKHFKNKEKLLADCIRSLSNYVCITWNLNGKNLYEKKEISKKVFGLFEKYLKESKKPLQSYAMLRVFKDWLIERIEIIENATNLQRQQIYDKESFMMVDNSIKDQIITNVMDALYSTHQKFENLTNLIDLNLEVIILLGYIYPEWKSKCGQNFIPRAIEVLDNQELGLDPKKKAIQLISQVTGCDDKSEEVNEEMLDFVAKNNGIKNITEAIAENDFDNELIEQSKQLLDQLGSKDERIEECYNDIDDLLKIVRDYNECDNKRDNVQIMKAKKAINKLNAMCLIEPLRIYCFDKDHAQIINDTWNYINEEKDKNLNIIELNFLKGLENGCIKTMEIHLNGSKDQSSIDQLYGSNNDDLKDKNNLLANSLRSLQHNQKDPKLIKQNSKIVNKIFPSQFVPSAKKIAKKLQFQKPLEYIFEEFGNDDDQELAQEVNTLFDNLSTRVDKERQQKQIKKVLQKFDNTIGSNNVTQILNSLKQITPMTSKETFSKALDDYNVLDYIERILKLLHANIEQKTGLNAIQLMEMGLSTTQCPDLGTENKKLLEDERKLAKEITKFMLKLDDRVKQKVREHDRIPQLSNVAGILNGSTETYKLYEDFLKEKKNQQKLKDNGTLETCMYLLMKNNKDIFKKEDIIEGQDLNVSTLNRMSISSMKVTDLRASCFSMEKTISDKNQIIQKNIDEFQDIKKLLIDKDKFEDIIKRYIKANNDYQPNNKNKLSELMYTSRLLQSLIATNDELDFKPYSKALKECYIQFLENSKDEIRPNKKMIKFFENIFNVIGKSLQDTDQNFKSKELWNQMVTKYFILSPHLLKQNGNQIFENMELCRPDYQLDPKRSKIQFIEQRANIGFIADVDPFGYLTEENAKNSKKILENFYKCINSNVIGERAALHNLKTFTYSSQFCEHFMDEVYFDVFLDKFDDSTQQNNPQNFNINSEILINLAETIQRQKQDNETLKTKRFHKIPAKKYLYPLLRNIEDDNKEFVDKSLETLNYLWGVIADKSLFKERNLPVILERKLKEDWNCSQNMQVLLCQSIGDPILRQQYDQTSFMKDIPKFCKQNLFIKNSYLKNPSDFSQFKPRSDISKDDLTRELELKGFCFGEIYKNQKFAQELLQNQPDTCLYPLNLYDEFLKYGHIPIVATKTIEAMKYGVFQMTDEDFKNNQDKVKYLLDTMPQSIEKYEKFQKTQKFLKEIYERLKLFQESQKPKDPIQKLIEQLSGEYHELTIDEILDSYKQFKEMLDDRELDNNELKALELLNQKTNDLINDESNIHTLRNLDAPKQLRLIANSPNSLMSEKESSIQLLNKFIENKETLEEMLQDDFMILKASELVDDLLKDKSQTSNIPQDELNVLKEDLDFLDKLTREQEGVRLGLDVDKNKSPLIQNLLKIIEGDNKDEDLKVKALQVLENLLGKSNDKNLEQKVLQKIPELLTRNQVNKQVYSKVISLAAEIANKSKENQEKLKEDDILNNIKQVLPTMRSHSPFLENSSKLINKLIENNKDIQPYVMQSDLFKCLANPFKSVQQNKELHKNISQALLELGYGNSKNKEEIIEDDFLKGLVPLLIHYSSNDHYNPEMITQVLKCMGNFSMVPEGVDHLLFDGVIPAFIDFFNQYKDKLDDQSKLMVQCLANLTYDQSPKFQKKIIDDKGIELILDTMKYYNDKKDDKGLEAGIDSLTHVSTNDQGLNYLEQNQNEAPDILIDVIRQKQNPDLVYKSLRCLTRFANSDQLAEQILNKDGQRAIADIFQDFQKDHKNIYQSLRCLRALLKKKPDKIEEFVFSGVPEKIIQHFDHDWPLDIIKESIALFYEMASNQEVKNLLSEQFLDDLVLILDKHIRNKPIVKKGIALLAQCSDNIVGAEAVQQNEGNKLCDVLLKKFLASEQVIMDTLRLMENTIILTKPTKPEFLEMKTDDQVEKIVDTTDPDTQEDLNKQAVKVLKLLRDEKDKQNGDDNQMDDIEEEDIDDISDEDNEQEEDDEQDLDKRVPPNIQKFLKQGRILRVYGEDKVCRSMHFYLSKDMKDLKCKHPKENFVKQKWIIPIHLCKDVKQGYNKTSPIAKSGGIFRKAPKKKRCFIVEGPLQIDGPKNFHMLCDNSFDAEKWVNYLQIVLKEYKKSKAQNLSSNLT